MASTMPIENKEKIAIRAKGRDGEEDDFRLRRESSICDRRGLSATKIWVMETSLYSIHILP